jgi:hypothetical protein
MSLRILTFNLGYICQHIGTVVQLYKIEKRRSTEGVCLDTQILFLLGTIARIFWIGETMLVKWSLTYIELVISLITLIITLYSYLFRYNDGSSLLQSLNKSNLPFFVRWYFILFVSIILSMIFFPGNEYGHYDFDKQTLVSFTIFVESSGLLPQIVAIHREKDSNNFSRIYIILLFISRVFRMIFWLEMYLNDVNFYYLLMADCINVVMVLGFIYTFFTNLNKLVLPTEIKFEGEKKFM